MKQPNFFLFLLYISSANVSAGCEAPFGTYTSKEGQTTITINTDQTLEIRKRKGQDSRMIYSGKFTNFDDLKGTEYLNFENAIDVKPFDENQSHLALLIGADCSMLKVGFSRRALELFGGKPPKLEAKLFWKND